MLYQSYCRMVKYGMKWGVLGEFSNGRKYKTGNKIK